MNLTELPGCHVTRFAGWAWPPSGVVILTLTMLVNIISKLTVARNTVKFVD